MRTSLSSIYRSPRVALAIGGIRWHGDCADHLTLCVELDALLCNDNVNTLREGTLPTLQALQEAHHNIVLVSSKTKVYTASLLKELGIQDILTCSSDTIPVQMPNPGVLIYAVETLAKGELSNAISIGCSSDNLKMAKGAGVPVIHIKKEGIVNGLSSTADLRIESFEDVLSGIEKLKDSSMY